MLGWAGSLYGYLYDYVFPRPAPGTVYGYRWQPGQGVPARLQQIDSAAVPPGIFVVFDGTTIDGIADPFGRQAGGPGPVFVAPATVPAAVANMVASVARNPPPGESGWTNPPPGRLADVGGFLTYVANCLDLIDDTATGHQLLTALTGGAYGTLISPHSAMNVTFSNNVRTLDRLTLAIRTYAQGGPLPKDAIRAAVEAQYSNIRGTLAKYNQLASDMNQAPLYSLFVAGANFVPRYLYSYFRFSGARLIGRNLLDWCSPGGFSAFDATVRGMTARRPQDGVILLEMFLLALCVALYPSAPRGPGAGSGVRFYTQNGNDNVIGSANFRPPAIGLAHELVHAMHYARGSSPGWDNSHFSTTVAELLFSGIGPSATEPINENAIRAQWGAITIPIDASNQWALPVQRTVYEPPQAGETVAGLRRTMNCL